MDADDRLATIWADACKQYFEITGIDQQKDGTAIEVTSAEKLMKVLEARQNGFSEFRAHKEKFWSRLLRIAEGLEAMAQIASGTVSQLYPQYAPIFGALSHLVRSAKNVTAAYDLIVKSFENLETFVTRMELYARHSIHPLLRKICVKKLACFHVIFALATRMIRKGRFSLYVDSVFMRESGVQQGFRQLEDLTANESALLQALNHTSQTEQSTTLGDIEDSVGTVDTRVRSIEAVVNSIDTSVSSIEAVVTSIDAGVKQLLEASASSASKFSDQPIELQLEILKKRLDPELSVKRDYENFKHGILTGTGEWILSHETFRSWRFWALPPSVLWITGEPGQGKTYLSSRIISSLLEDNAQNEGRSDYLTSVAYFFCHVNESRTRSFPIILRTMAYQIARQDAAFRAYLLKVLNEDSISTLSTIEAWKVLFSTFFTGTDNQSFAYLVIDGLDEAVRDGFDGVETFLKSIESLLHQPSETASTRLKLILVGRREMDDMLSTALGVVPTINLSGRNNVDLIKYIDDQFTRSPTIQSASPSFREEARRRLSGRGFLWVKIVCGQLQKNTRESHMRATLDAFPDDLQAAIRQSLEHFSKGSPEDIADLTEMLTLVMIHLCAAPIEPF